MLIISFVATNSILIESTFLLLVLSGFSCLSLAEKNLSSVLLIK